MLWVKARGGTTSPARLSAPYGVAVSRTDDSMHEHGDSSASRQRAVRRAGDEMGCRLVS